jgi:tetratricopeptide (TPR) repeat protein
LKFALVAPESLITSERGIHFIDLVEQMIKAFGDIETLQNSVSLIISHATPGKKAKHLEKSISKILKDNKSLSDQTKEVISKLLKSVHLFHKPTSEEVLSESSLLKDLSNGIEFVETSKISANMELSKKAKEHATKLLNITEYSLKSLLDILDNASQNASSCLRMDKDNIFVNRYQYFHKFLPKNMQKLNVKYTHKYSNKDHFVDLDQQKALADIFNGVDLHKLQQSDLVKIAHAMLDTFRIFVIGKKGSEGAEVDLVQNMIKNYSYILDQQLKYIEFFQEATGQKVNYQNSLLSTLNNCQKAITINLEKQIKVIKLEESSEIGYYKKAIEHLSIYKDDKDCMLKIAKANDSIGDIYAQNNNPNKALSFYIKALKLDKTLAETYEKLGDILADKEKYKTALDFYKVADQVSKVKLCYDKLIEKASTKESKLNIFEEKGDYLASIGETQKAIKSYNKAKELTYDKDIKAELLEKIVALSKNRDEIIKNMELIKENGDFFNFSFVQEETLDLLLGDVLDH